MALQLAGDRAARKASYRHDGNCCSAQVLPSGSLKVTNEPHGCTPMSLACTPLAMSCCRAASTAATTHCTPFCEPGGIWVIPVPSTMEQAGPGGVSCANRSASVPW